MTAARDKKRIKEEKLILFLCPFSYPHKNALASTLAWMASERGYIFDVYYDTFRLGDHFGGGPLEKAEKGRPFGSTITGHAHVEAWNQLLSTFECFLVLVDSPYFKRWIDPLRLPVVSSGGDPILLASGVAGFLGLDQPKKLLILGGAEGEDAYLYPVVANEKAIALHYTTDIDPTKIKDLGITVVETLLCREKEMQELCTKGIEISRFNSEYPAGSFSGLSEALSRRWSPWCRGYFLGDPVVTAYFIPFLVKNQLLALHNNPQKEIIKRQFLPGLEAHPLVYGRMQSDEEALEVSRLGGCWQLVDPGRPPFPVASRAIDWSEVPYDLFSYIDALSSEDKLREHAESGDILSTLVFWSGCVREMENFYRLFELVGISGFKCGAAVTAETFLRGAQTPFGLITHPRELGGVFPLVEPLLASSGVGFSLEGYLPEGALINHVEAALSQIKEKLPEGMHPKGWWACLDTRLEANSSSESRLRNRPFGNFKPGEPVSCVYDCLVSHGFLYAVSKAPSRASRDGGRSLSVVQRGDFRALPQTAGRWQGWSPFHDIEHIEDVKQAEKRIFLNGAPGFLLGTVDACLWTFSYPLWERGGKLKAIIDFIKHGGRTGKLVNAHPYTIYRYAAFLEENGFVEDASTMRSLRMLRRWYTLRAGHLLQKFFLRKKKRK